MAAMQWAYSLPIGNRVQHLSAASMGALPHLRKSFANGLNKLEGDSATSDDGRHASLLREGGSVRSVPMVLQNSADLDCRASLSFDK